MTTISACIIVKNEENNILRCLKSIKDKVDEIIIVDTGSTDSTKHLAKRFTDRIYNFKFEEADGIGNFARARNYSISKAKGDYIFWIDADEELLDLNNSFRSLVTDNPESVFFRQAQCVPIEDHPWNADQLHDRLFKKGTIEFIGVIHEYPSKDGIDFLPNSVFQQNCYILHYGLANLKVKSYKAIERNGPLIEKNLRLNPNNPMAHYHMMALLWSKRSFDPDNQTYMTEAFDIWDSYFKSLNSKTAQKMAAKVLQRFMNEAPESFVKYDDGVQFLFGRTNEEAEYFFNLIMNKYSNNMFGNDKNGDTSNA
jgi:glycosyltransferase involved in cell wall biosynthesis